MKKKIIIVIVVLFVLAAIGSALPEENNQINDSDSTTQSAQSNTQSTSDATTESKEKNTDSANENASSEASKEASEAEPKISVDSMLDSVTIDSYEVTKDGVTLNLSFDDSNENNWVTCNIKSFSFNNETVPMEYNSKKDKYIAKGVVVKENDETSYWGMFQLQGGTSTKIKFSVNDFKKIEDYDGFKVTIDQKYSGSFSGEIKDDYIEVHVS